MSEPPAGSPPGVRAGERLLAELRAEIGRADAKAAVLVAAMGVSTAAWTGAVAVAGTWEPGRPAWPGLLLWWTGCLAWAASLACLLAAVAPRYRRGSWTPGDTLAYFHDIREAAEADELREALRRTEERPLDSLVDALTDTSRIAAAKHRWVRAALACFAVGFALVPAGAAAALIA
ncbi:MAG TPA: Pycsar system effector family protein [Streptomyces sp.]|uniref:Pycsar system effector family protein n=1 Tax=Streptomyces sp. TaxID=1931 RepID=UPI002D3A3ED3|nr:Pycsar system effector family protein [Streptomyces sp.]HZG06241.1 Pycsar system effector family protein [Streptomyces sp.]